MNNISPREDKSKSMILDLHVHSKYSFDSVSSLQRIITAAQRRGLNGIAITDHNTIRGGIEARKINSAPDFLVIVGAEIATEAGDLIGLFLKEEIQERYSDGVIDEIHQQGGIVVLPHPYKGHELKDELLRKVDLIEGFNARVNEEYNEKAVKLAHEWNKPIVAGSDAHFVAEIGLARTIVNIPAGENIKPALLNNQIETSCIQTLGYWVLLSQIIKVVKARQYRRVPVRLASIIKNWLAWGK
ncbi:MAG: PHP domain-containing protein [Dehalococcoidia bacterium]|nr:PHP domain-containing protein [Dehalococcoidia bacterium]